MNLHSVVQRAVSHKLPKCTEFGNDPLPRSNAYAGILLCTVDLLQVDAIGFH